MSGFFEENKEEKEIKPKPVNKPSSRKGKISSFIEGSSGKWIILDVDGNGERLKFNPKEHENLKIGDVVVIT